jgi:TRAP-type C4-dicarboxylate transport system substrate-binding protein
VSKASDHGFRQIHLLLETHQDAGRLQGYRIRVPVSPMFTSLFKALGASPTSINFNELYTALQHAGRWPGRTASSHRIGKLYEVAEVRIPDESHQGSVLAAGNRRGVGNLPTA